LRGILKVDPVDGKQSLFLPLGAASSSEGDGGPVSAAKVYGPRKIALDFFGRLIILDYNRIRRVDLTSNPPTINTIIGGGASSADDVDPLSLSVAGTTHGQTSADYTGQIFVVLPDGKIIFQSDGFGSTLAGGFRLRIYDPVTNKVTMKAPISVAGHTANTTADLTNYNFTKVGLSFDSATSAITDIQACALASVDRGTVRISPATWQTTTPIPPAPSWTCYANMVTGMDGRLYRATAYFPIQRWNPLTSTWDSLAGMSSGGGSVGYCADGTAALSCRFNLQDIFVTSSGKLYLMDAGMIRTLDDSGNLITIAGQSLAYGDGLSPLNARFGEINSLGLRGSGEIIVLDALSQRFREFSSSVIQTIAGDGREATPDTVANANVQSISYRGAGLQCDNFALDPSNGDVYFNRSGGFISVLKRSTGKWTDLVGGGAIQYYSSANGTLGNQIIAGGYQPRVLGFSSGSILASHGSYTYPNASEAFYKIYSTADGAQTHLAGINGTAGGSYCADGTSSTACNIPHVSNTGHLAEKDSGGTEWFLSYTSTNKIRRLAPGGTMATLVTLSQNIRSFTHSRATGTLIVYYCDVNGRLRKWNQGTSTETVLTWPVTSMQCSGRTLVFKDDVDPTKRTLIFPYTQNGLVGVAEYINP
jgi:hypothetical protein